MQAPITVNYTPDGEDWTVTVNVSGAGETRSARAAGLIAARDQADQLVDQLVPTADGRTVVHLLEGDAYAFTTSYLHARLGLSMPAQQTEPNTTQPTDNTQPDQVNSVITEGGAPGWPVAPAAAGPANMPVDGAH